MSISEIKMQEIYLSPEINKMIEDFISKHLP